MWYAAKNINQRDRPRRVFLRRSEPVVSTEVRGMYDPPSYGAAEFDSRAAALEAARLIGGPGRRVAVPVAACPHGCGDLDWVDDNYRCRCCGDEWSHETIRGYPIPA